MRNCWAPCTLKEATPFITKPICSALTMFRYTDIMAVVMRMSINEIIDRSGMTKYRIAKLSGIPHATLNDLCSGKTHIEKCSGETLYRLSKTLQLPIEQLLESAMEQKLQRWHCCQRISNRQSGHTVMLFLTAVRMLSSSFIGWD